MARAKVGAIDESLRKYQTSGEPQTNKLDTDNKPELMRPPMGVAVQFDDVRKKDLAFGDCPGCNY